MCVTRCGEDRTPSSSDTHRPDTPPASIKELNTPATPTAKLQTCNSTLGVRLQFLQLAIDALRTTLLEIKFEDHDFPSSVWTLDKPKLLLEYAHHGLVAVKRPAALQLHHAKVGHLTTWTFVSVWSEADGTLQQGVPQGGEGVLLAHPVFLYDLAKDTQHKNIRSL